MLINFIRKYIYEIVTVIVFGITRTVNLGIIPIFTDEAIYTYWAQVALNDPANRYISLEDGKQPLFIWLAALAQLVINDPLLAARSISIFSGAVSLVVIYLLAKDLFGAKTARIAAILYVVLPFTLLYDRMALYDSLLTAICLLTVYLSIKLAQKPRLDYALLTGIVLGAGLITKSSAALFLVLLPAPLILLSLKKKTWLKQTMRWIPLAVLAAIIAEVIYNSLRLSQLFYLIDRKNYSFIRPISAFLKEPFALFYSNSTSILKWVTSYIGYPLLAIFVLTLIYGLYTKNRKIILLAVYVLFPFAIEVFFNIVLYPRFVLFYIPYLIIIIAYGFYLLWQSGKVNKIVCLLIFILAVGYPIVNSFFLLTNPTRAQIASSDYGQYIDSWPAGYGVKEVTSVLTKESQKGPVYMGTEGTFGLLPFALDIYFSDKSNPQISGFWPVNADTLPQQVLDAAKTKKTYFLFNENQKEILNPKLHLVAKYQKGTSASFMRLYEVK